MKVSLKRILYFYFSFTSLILNAQEKIAYIDENKLCSCVKLTQTIIENDTIPERQDYPCPYELYYCDYDVLYFANAQKLLLPIKSTKKPFNLIYNDIFGCLHFLNSSFKDSCITWELNSKRKIIIKPRSIYYDTIVTLIEENGEKIEKTCIYKYIFHDFIDAKNIIFSNGYDLLEKEKLLGAEDFWCRYEGGFNKFSEDFQDNVHKKGSLKAELYLTKNGEATLNILESSSPEFEQKVMEFIKNTKWKTNKSVINTGPMKLIIKI